MSSNKDLGDFGEQVAIDFYHSLGYTIIAHNYYVRGGEIDLIAEKNDILAFVEVKTRSSRSFMEARESVGIRKQARIIKAAQKYLNENPSDKPCRFDVVEVYVYPEKTPEIIHLPDAFQL